MSANARPPRPAAVVLRTAIEKAVEAGGRKDDMLLRLTLKDAADLKRDRSLPIEDISFSDGEMRFLGVKVTAGGVTESSLDVGQPAT